MPARSAAGDGDEGRSGFWRVHVAWAAKGLSPLLLADDFEFFRFFFAHRRMAGDAEQNADANEHGQEVGAAVTDKRQRQAFVWQGAGDDPDVDGRLEANQQRRAGGQEESKSLAGINSDAKAAYGDDYKGQHNGQASQPGRIPRR